MAGFFYYVSISCNRNIVSRNSMILISKLGVSVDILLITFWNRLSYVPVTDPKTRSPASIKLPRSVPVVAITIAMR